MKKQILISTLALTVLWTSTALILINTANAQESKVTSDSLIATSSTISENPTKLSTSKDETVYIIADESGSTKTTFIGSTIYTGNEALPFNFKITYYLDGNEISAKDLAGKSGHIKIIYTYSSSAKYLGKNIPFLAISGLTLNHANFNNLKLTNGKIVTETSDSYIIAGYGVTGLNTNFGTNLLPETFILEADTTNFKLADSYTIFTNELLAEIDTSKLTSLDNLTNSIYELSDGLNKIIAGSTELSNGLSTALSGTKELHAGSQKLASGLSELKSNNDKLIAGAEQLTDMAPTIVGLMEEKKAALTTQKAGLEAQKTDLENQLANIPDIEATAEIRGQIAAGIEQINAGITQINTGIARLDAGMAGLSKLDTFYDGLIEYTSGVASAAAGANELSNGLGSLLEGETQLYKGSVTLKDGLTTFKTSGIDKLVNFASKDLANFTANARTSINAAASYRSFGDTDAKSVKFIVKTPSI